jgi:hypothetical protein
LQVIYSLILIFGLLCSCRTSLFTPLDKFGRKDIEDIEEEMKKDPQKAIKKAREVLKRDPNNNKVRLLLADALIKQNDLSPSRRAIKKGIAGDSANKDLLVADVKDYEKDLDSKQALKEAIDSLQRLVNNTKGKDRQEAQFMYAELLIEQGFAKLKAKCFAGGEFDKEIAQISLGENDAIDVLNNFALAKENYTKAGKEESKKIIGKLLEKIHAAKETDSKKEKIIAFLEKEYPQKDSK